MENTAATSRQGAERIAEIAEVLALGLIRLRARKSREYSLTDRDSSLDCVAHQSGHATPEKGRAAR